MTYLRTRAARVAASLAALVAVLSTLLTLTAGPASAASAGWRLINKNSSLDLEVAGWSVYPGAAVDQWQDNGGNGNPGYNQQWIFISGNQLANVYSGLCLTTDGVAGHQLTQQACLNGWTQTWNRVYSYSQDLPFSTDFYFLQNPASGLVVDVNGASTGNGAAVIGWPCNYGANQLWELS